MPHAWLYEVLRDIEDYAIQNEVCWLLPYIRETNQAAKWETDRIGNLLPRKLTVRGRPSYLGLVHEQTSADERSDDV